MNSTLQLLNLIMNKFHGAFFLALLGVMGMFYITIKSPNQIEHFAPIATGAVSGYLTLLQPKSKEEKEKDSNSSTTTPNKGINPGD